MGACKMCGVQIIDGEELCDSCKAKVSLDVNDVDINSIEDIDMSAVDMNGIEDIDMSAVDMNGIEDIDMSAVDMNSIEDIDMSAVDMNSIEDIDMSDIDMNSIEDMDMSDIDMDSIEDMNMSDIDMSSIEDMNMGDIDMSSIEDIDMSDIDMSSIEDMDMNDIAMSSMEDLTETYAVHKENILEESNADKEDIDFEFLEDKVEDISMAGEKLAANGNNAEGFSDLEVEGLQEDSENVEERSSEVLETSANIERETEENEEGSLNMEEEEKLDADFDIMSMLGLEDEGETKDTEQASTQENEDILGMLDLGLEQEASENKELTSEASSENLFALDDILSVPGEENNSVQDLLGDVTDILGGSMEATPNEGEPVEEGIVELPLMAEENEEATVETEKKPGFFKRLFGNIKDDKWEKQQQIEAEKEKKAAEEKAKKAEKKEEGATEGEEGSEVVDKKAEKEAAKKAKKEAKEQAKQAKKEQKEKLKEIVAEVETEEGRINPVGAGIVFFLVACLGAFVIMGTNVFSYNQSIQNANEFYKVKKYTKAYNEVRGLKIKKKDREIYNKIITVMHVNKEFNSFYNYYGVEMYPEALDSLLKGLVRYDKYIYDAKELEITEDFNYVRKQIIAQLKSSYELSEEEAYKLIDTQNQEEYSSKVIEIANGEE